uniref:Uncharacterized protein n=1 Tax=Ralstonia solanacearum TaxID=305 RepID=A0A0S4TWN9_RALSL|nr:protein of unknown function [Ralstonia solanacearum]
MAWRPTNQYIEGFSRRSKLKITDKLFRTGFGYVACLRVSWIAVVEISAMRGCGFGVKFHSCCDAEACC